MMHFNRISPEIHRMLAKKFFWDQNCPPLDHELNLKEMFLNEIPNQTRHGLHLVLLIFLLTENLFILLNEAPRPIAICCHLKYFQDDLGFIINFENQQLLQAPTNADRQTHSQTQPFIIWMIMILTLHRCWDIISKIC